MDEARLVVQLAIGAVLLLSASGKLLNPAGFARGVTQYQILPQSLAYGVGLFLIPLEVFLAVSHLTGWLLAFAVPIGLATLVSFTAAVAINLRRGRALPCYCFGGQGGETISGRTLARLLLLLAGELLLLTDVGLINTSKLTYPDRIAEFSELGPVLSRVMLLLIAGLWLLNANDVIELFHRGYASGARAAGADSHSAQHPPDEPA